MAKEQGIFGSVYDDLGFERGEIGFWGDNDQAGANLEAWTKNLVDTHKKIAFLDLTITDVTATNVFGFHASRGADNAEVNGALDAYLECVHQVIWSDGVCRTVGGHQAFLAGLPIFQSTELKTADDIADVYNVRGLPDDERYLTGALETIPQTCGSSDSSGNIVDTRKITPEVLGYPADIDEYHAMLKDASRRPVDENWNYFLDVLKHSTRPLLDAEGAPLSVVYGVPITIWRPVDSPRYFSIAQLILGVGDGDPRDQAKLLKSVSGRVAGQAFKSNALPLMSQADEDGRRRSTLHSLPYVVNSVLESTRKIEEDLCELQRRDQRLFDKLPDSIKHFKYPVELYEGHVKAAMQIGSQNLPGLAFLEEDILNHGLTVNIVADLSDRISLPSARHRIAYDGFQADRIEKPNIIGDSLSLAGQSRQEVRVIVAALCGVIREALYHRERYRIKLGSDCEPVQVTLSSVGLSSIEIQNPCSKDARPNNLDDRFQKEDIKEFNANLRSWRIKEPAVLGGNWIRQIQHV